MERKTVEGGTDGTGSLAEHRWRCGQQALAIGVGAAGTVDGDAGGKRSWLIASVAVSGGGVCGDGVVCAAAGLAGVVLRAGWRRMRSRFRRSWRRRGFRTR